MYSPKIAEELVPVLYRLAKERKMPMTRLVNSMIREALAGMNLSGSIADSGACSPCVRESEPPKAAAA